MYWHFFEVFELSCISCFGPHIALANFFALWSEHNCKSRTLDSDDQPTFNSQGTWEKQLLSTEVKLKLVNIQILLLYYIARWCLGEHYYAKNRNQRYFVVIIIAYPQGNSDTPHESLFVLSYFAKYQKANCPFWACIVDSMFLIPLGNVQSAARQDNKDGIYSVPISYICTLVGVNAHLRRMSAPTATVHSNYLLRSQWRISKHICINNTTFKCGR